MRKGSHHNEETKRLISQSKHGISPNRDYAISEETRKKISNTLKGRKLPEETKRKISIKMMGTKNSIGNKNAVGHKHTEETKRHLSDIFKGKKPCDEAYILLPRGEKHHAWNGGSSYTPYCTKFSEVFKEHVRCKFDHLCYLCHSDGDGRDLDVHHIDYNKNSICTGHEWAFVTLCRSHHMKSNFNRWYWFNLLINYWAMNPDINFLAVDQWEFNGMIRASKGR